MIPLDLLIKRLETFLKLGIPKEDKDIKSALYYLKKLQRATNK